MKSFIYSLNFKVRDYECDLQSVVNNSVYLNYLEHTRHEFLKSIGLDFEDLTKNNLAPMVYKAEITYKSPLRSGDEFISTINIIQEGTLKLVFQQKLYRKNDKKLMLKANITKVIVKNAKVCNNNSYFKTIINKINENIT